MKNIAAMRVEVAASGSGGVTFMVEAAVKVERCVHS